MSAATLDFPAMPKKSDRVKQQMGLELDRANLDRLRAYANNHPLQPSLTRLIDMAIAEWLDNHEGEVSKPSPDRKAK